MTSRWVGYIKDYDGGTLMECYIHPAVPYTMASSVVEKQQKFIVQRLTDLSGGNQDVYSLDSELGKRSFSALDWPGVKEAGWQAFQIYKNSNERDRNATQAKLQTTLRNLMEKVRLHNCAAVLWQVRSERGGEVVGFDEIQEQLRGGEYYRCKEALGADLLRLINFTKQRMAANDPLKEACTPLTAFVQDLFMKPESASSVSTAVDS